MTIKNTLSATKAREDFFALISKVQTPGQHVTLTDKGTPKAVIMSAHEFESWMETMEVVQLFPDLKENISDAEREYREGRFVTLDQIMAEEGYVPKDKATKGHGVSRHYSSKRQKRAC